MSSVIDYNDCPQCGNEYCYTTDYNCKTGEDHGFCAECGKTYHHYLERDEDGKLKRKLVSYPREEIILKVLENETDKVLFKKNFNDVENITKEMVFGFLNRKHDFGEETEKVETDPKVINESLFGDGPNVKMYLDGFACLYHVKDGKEERIFYRGDDMEIQEDVLIIKETIWKDEDKKGNGVFFFKSKKGGGAYHCVNDNTTLEDVKNDFFATLSDPKNEDLDVEHCFATWFNHETNELVRIKKTVESVED